MGTFSVPELAAFQGVTRGKVFPLFSSQQWENVVDHLAQEPEAETEFRESNIFIYRIGLEEKHEKTKKKNSAYEEMLVLACSCISSPLGLTVNILLRGMPTSL